ncbi:MAG: segregation/condensation protein A [Patescibacteria group bacterium]
MPYVVKQEKFEGPLDLLLELIQKQELSINEISLAKVTDEFISDFKNFEEDGSSDQEVLAEFLVIAATLLLIKSRSLLPQYAVSPEEEASIQELEERLKEYQRLKEMALELGRMAQGGPHSFSREAHAGIPPMFRPPKNATPSALGRAFEAVIRAIPRMEKLAKEKIKKIISLEEKIKELQYFLQKKVERAFSELVAGAKEKIEVIVSFLAILELAKQKLVTLHQTKPFEEIIIRKQ